MCKQMFIKRSLFDKIFIHTGAIKESNDLNPLDSSLLDIIFNPKIIRFDDQQKIDFMSDKVSLCVKLIIIPPTKESSVVLVDEYGDDNTIRKISLPGGHVDDMNIKPTPMNIINSNLVREFCEEYYGHRTAIHKFNSIKDPTNLRESLEELGLQGVEISDQLYYMYTPSIINSFAIYRVVTISDMNVITYERSTIITKEEFNFVNRIESRARQLLRSDVENDIRCNDYRYILRAIFNSNIV